MSYQSFALVGFISAGLTTLFSREMHILNIGIGAIIMALLQVGLSLGQLDVRYFQSSLEPFSTSLSVSTMYLAGALVGAKLFQHFRSRILPDNLVVTIAVVFLTILGTLYLNSFVALLFSGMTNSIYMGYILSLLLSSIIAGYVVQACTRKKTDSSFVFALFLLLTIFCTKAGIEEGIAAMIIVGLVGFILFSLYFLIAKIGMVLANKRHAPKPEKPEIPTAKAIHG